MNLNALMEIDHVVRVLPDGTVTDKKPDGTWLGVYAPEVSCDYDGPFADAQILDEHDRDMIAGLKAQGWSVANGWSQQDSYSGPIMHTSECIGGALADHIRETPGYWVALSVEIHPGEDDPEYDDGNGESESAGWILAHKEIPDPHDSTQFRDPHTHKGWTIAQEIASGLMVIFRPDGTKYGETQTDSAARIMRRRALEGNN